MEDSGHPLIAGAIVLYELLQQNIHTKIMTDFVEYGLEKVVNG